MGSKTTRAVVEVVLHRGNATVHADQVLLMTIQTDQRSIGHLAKLWVLQKRGIFRGTGAACDRRRTHCYTPQKLDGPPVSGGSEVNVLTARIANPVRNQGYEAPLVATSIDVMRELAAFTSTRDIAATSQLRK